MSFEKYTAAYVIQLVASAVNSQTPPPKPENISWENVVEFSIKQNVLNIVGYACETLECKPDEKVMQFLREFIKHKAVIEAEQEVVCSELMDKLEEADIKYMPLKGYIIKNLYPRLDMRTMGDIDFLVEEEKIDGLISDLTSDDYIFLGHGDLHSNVKKGRTHIEFHRTLFNKSYRRLTEYFGVGFERAVKNEEKSYRYDLKNEDMYIFLLAHLAKHYRYAGTGIRTVLDIYIFRKAYPELDMNYIHTQTAEIGLLKFQKKIEVIADDWFGGSFNGEFNSVSAYIASGGVYGSEDMNNVNKMINSSENITAGKAKSVFMMVFPPYSLMSELFPVLKKHKLLLPLFWIIRWIKSLSSDRQNLKNTISTTNKIISADDFYVKAQRDAEIEEL